VDIRQVNQFVRRVFYLKERRHGLISVRTNTFAYAIFDHAGRQQEWGVNPGLNFELAGSTFIGVNANRGFERFSNLNFRNGGFGFYAHSEYFRKATLDLNFDRNRRINYDPAGTLAPFRAPWTSLRTTLTFRPAARLKLDEVYLYNHLDHVFINHVMRSKVNYQFSKELSLRLIMDYSATLPNTSLSALEKSKRVTGDVLLTWLLHPGTAFYLGYTDRLENQALLAGAPPALGRLDFPSTTTSRLLFMKLSYLFRF
jgi:hypothetical protein